MPKLKSPKKPSPRNPSDPVPIEWRKLPDKDLALNTHRALMFADECMKEMRDAAMRREHEIQKRATAAAIARERVNQALEVKVPLMFGRLEAQKERDELFLQALTALSIISEPYVGIDRFRLDELWDKYAEGMTRRRYN